MSKATRWHFLNYSFIWRYFIPKVDAISDCTHLQKIRSFFYFLNYFIRYEVFCVDVWWKHPISLLLHYSLCANLFIVALMAIFCCSNFCFWLSPRFTNLGVEVMDGIECAPQRYFRETPCAHKCKCISRCNLEWIGEETKLKEELAYCVVLEEEGDACCVSLFNISWCSTHNTQYHVNNPSKHFFSLLMIVGCFFPQNQTNEITLATSFNFMDTMKRETKICLFMVGWKTWNKHILK